jgi:hypothetical protein
MSLLIGLLAKLAPPELYFVDGYDYAELYSGKFCMIRETAAQRVRLKECV